jgi:hypothetical protein
MSFWRNVSPRRAARDLHEQLIAPNPHRLRFMALAAAVTASIFLLMFKQEAKGPPRPPEIVYFPSFLPGRTDAEIIAGNIEATRKMKEEEAAREAREDEVRKIYRAVGNATGIDADKAFAEGTREREAAKKELQEKREALLRSYGGPREN